MANSSRRNLNLKGLRVIDLRTTRPDGQNIRTFSLREHRRDALRLIGAEDPDWLIVGNPCTQVSSLNYGLNHKQDASRSGTTTLERCYVTFALRLPTLPKTDCKKHMVST